jgi:hypothetical protein
MGTVISSAGDQPALNRICGPGTGSGIFGMFRLASESVVSKGGFGKVALLLSPKLLGL